MNRKRVLFYYLSAFSNTGGIEKFNKCFIKALSELDDEGEIKVSAVSAYDDQPDLSYITGKCFYGFSKKRFRSVMHVARAAAHYDTVILGHINLAVAGVFIKLFKPRCQVVLIAHGIEIWNRLSFIKRQLLKKADRILAVSNYTRNQLVLQHNIDHNRVRLFPNTIDPFFRIPRTFSKPTYLLERYGLSASQPVVLTIARLSSNEQYKGYDKMIEAMPQVLKSFPGTVYIIAGKYDETEKARVEGLIRQNGLQTSVRITGFIADEELQDHYQLADVFIMPSTQEGFGIVFIEAMACGTPVIGGNQDGTADALRGGQFGKMVNPLNASDIAGSVIRQLREDRRDPSQLQHEVMHAFGYPVFKKRLKTIFNWKA